MAALHPIHNSHQERKISVASLACSQKEQIWAAMQTARKVLGRKNWLASCKPPSICPALFNISIAEVAKFEQATN